MLNYKHKEGSKGQALKMKDKEMKQVDYDTGYRLLDGRAGTVSSNTKIVYCCGWFKVELFGNVIAEYNGAMF